MIIQKPAHSSRELAPNQARMCIIITALGYSLMGLVLKFATIHPLVFSGMERAVCLLILGLYRGSFRARFNRKTILGALLSYSTSVLFVLANKLTTAANAVILQYTYPIIVIVITRFFLHKKVSKWNVLLCLIMLCGMLLFFRGELSAGNLLGNIVAIISGVTMALANMYAHYSKTDVCEYFMVNCMMAIAVGAVVAPFVDLQLSLPSASAAVIYGIFCSAIPMIFLAKGAPLVDPVNISMLLMIEPILGPLLVALFFGEYPTGSALLGASIVLLGVCANNLYPLVEKRLARKTQISVDGSKD